VELAARRAPRRRYRAERGVGSASRPRRGKSTRSSTSIDTARPGEGRRVEPPTRLEFSLRHGSPARSRTSAIHRPCGRPLRGNWPPFCESRVVEQLARARSASILLPTASLRSLDSPPSRSNHPRCPSPSSLSSGPRDALPARARSTERAPARLSPPPGVGRRARRRAHPDPDHELAPRCLRQRFARTSPGTSRSARTEASLLFVPRASRASAHCFASTTDGAGRSTGRMCEKKVSAFFS
jgi:hypothetical protein